VNRSKWINVAVTAAAALTALSRASFAKENPAVERVSGPLTLTKVEFVQRQRAGNGREELIIQGLDPYSGRPAQAQLQEGRVATGILAACERFALIALNRPARWQLTFSLAAAVAEGVSLEVVQKDKSEWRVLRADLDHLGDAESQLRCALQPASAQTSGGSR
jgi:hypothetical protein